MLIIIVYVLLILSIPIVTGLVLWQFMFKNEVRSIMLARACRRRAINCLRCSDCCTKLVVLSRKDIANIRRYSGIAEKDFIDLKFGIPCLRRNPEGRCIFFTPDADGTGGGQSACWIYEGRPAACRRFPHLKYWGFAGIDHRCRAARNHMNQEE